MSGILLITTFSLVSKTAQIICKASFFAPCGTISPFNCLPPVTSKIAIYGKTIENIISKAKDLKDGPEKDELTRLIANHLKKSYINWNKDSITDDVILKNLTELSGGALKMDEATVLSSSQELRGNSGTGGGNKPRHKFQNNKFKHKHNKNRRKH